MQNQYFDVIINLAGANISKRWTKYYKEELINSRVVTTRNLISLIKKLKRKPGLLINASAIGYYGIHKNGTILDEQSEYNNDFTHLLCKKWEYEAMKAKNHGVRVCIARFGIVIRSTERFKKGVKMRGIIIITKLPIFGKLIILFRKSIG